MIPQSVMAVIAAAIASEHRRNAYEFRRLYDLAVWMLVKAKPDLTRFSSVRMVNSLLEVADPTGRTYYDARPANESAELSRRRQG